MASLYQHPPLFHRPSTIRCSKLKNPEPFKENKQAQVDYDAGTHRLHTTISGLRKSDLPKRNRLRVEGDRFQKDWSMSEVVERILELNHWEDIESVLNRWAGRFARKNFPFLIRVKFRHRMCVFSVLLNLSIV